MDPETTPENTPDAIERTGEKLEETAEALASPLMLTVSMLADRADSLETRVANLEQRIPTESESGDDLAEADGLDELDEATEDLEQLLTPAAMPQVTVQTATAAIDPETMAPSQIPDGQAMPDPMLKGRRRGLFRRRLGNAAMR